MGKTFVEKMINIIKGCKKALMESLLTISGFIFKKMKLQFKKKSTGFFLIVGHIDSKIHEEEHRAKNSQNISEEERLGGQ